MCLSSEIGRIKISLVLLSRRVGRNEIIHTEQVKRFCFLLKETLSIILESTLGLCRIMCMVENHSMCSYAMRQDLQ